MSDKYGKDLPWHPDCIWFNPMEVEKGAERCIQYNVPSGLMMEWGFKYVPEQMWLDAFDFIEAKGLLDEFQEHLSPMPASVRAALQDKGE